MKTVQNSTINLIAGFEGFQSKAYWDHKQYSIGYGSGKMPDGRAVKSGDLVTRIEAWEMLKRDAAVYASVVNRLVKVQLSQNQFDALTSLVYNIGEGAFSGSTLLRRVNENPKNTEVIKKEFQRWVYASGVVNAVLVSRRKKEADLYAAPGYVNQVPFFFVAILIILLIRNRRKRKPIIDEA